MATLHVSSPHPFAHRQFDTHQGPKARLQSNLLSPETLFPEAARLFMEIRSLDPMTPPGTVPEVGPVRFKQARYVRPNTARAYERQAKSLALFFSTMTLGEIQWPHLRAYQAARIAGNPPFIRRRRPQDEPGPCPCKPVQVNQELSFLKRLKTLASCWTIQDDRFYLELQEDESDIRRALTPEEQALWLEAARSYERWNLIFWYSLLAFETTMSTNEARGLRIGDVNLDQQTISIPWPAAKNRYRRRIIALQDADTLWACERLLERAHRLGSQSATDYLFPFRDTRTNRTFPDRPMSPSGLKKLWQEVRAATGLAWFRPYDTRHTAITRMAERGVPIPLIMARAGHISPRMTEHYTHIGLAAQRNWDSYTRERQDQQKGRPRAASRERPRAPMCALPASTASTSTPRLLHQEGAYPTQQKQPSL